MSKPEETGQPERSHPHMPGYGITPGEDGMIDWAWAEDRMRISRNYWVCSTRPDGRPHAAPVWGVWLDGALYFGSERGSRKVRNFAASPEIVIHLESGDDAVILEGVVEPVRDRALLERMADAYAAKYPPYRPDPDEDGSAFYAFRPRTAFAWQEHDFPRTATRWRFNAR